MWRRMAMAVWRDPADPQVYARLEVDMGKALEYAAEESRRTGVRITPTHLVARAVALCLKEHPDANALVRWNRVYQRKRIHVFFQVAIPGPQSDLSGATVRDVDTKSPAEIAEELSAKAKQIRNGTDREFSPIQRKLDRIPTFLYRPVLRLITLVQYTLNWGLGWLGMPEDPFGSAMVTSIGSLGVAEAFAPLVPLTRSPMVVAVGRVEDKPAVRDGQIVIRPMCVLCVTFDHRIMDGLLAGKLAKGLLRYLADPAECERRHSSPD
jgi:pyruvate dehydrogenase E2 component (dihydrolipoamide acetyltransferase)